MNDPSGGKAASPALSDFIVLNEEIAALVRAQIPLESNLARVGMELPGKAGELAQRVGRRLDAGESLVSAVDAECGSMPPTYRAVLLAGIESGRLGGALEATVDSATRLDQLRRVTGVAMLYPLALFVLVCLLLAVVVEIIAPSFEWLEHSRLRVFAALSRFEFAGWMIALGIPGLVLLCVATWWWSSGRLSGAGWPRLGLLSTLSGAGRVYRWNEAARFAELLHLLVDRGLPLDRSLQLCAESTGDRKLREAASQLARQVTSGEAAQLSPPSATSKPLAGFPVLIRLALYHANDRPLLSGSLRQASMMYRERAIRLAEWYSEYLPILLTVVVGGLFTVGFTLLVIWPYASMLHDLSRPGWR